MVDQGRTPTRPDDDVERTGRTDQVAPNEGFGAPGSAREQRSGLDEDDAAPGGVDSADFPGTAAP